MGNRRERVPRGLTRIPLVYFYMGTDSLYLLRTQSRQVQTEKNYEAQVDKQATGVLLTPSYTYYNTHIKYS